MFNKTKILWLSDCSVTNNSGFSKVSLELLSRLSKNENYELAELGINNPKGEGYKLEPNWKIYTSGTKPHCEDKFVPTVLDFKPDVVISLLDIHMFAYINDLTQVPIEVRNSFKFIAHTPIDGAPLDTWGLNVASGCNALACIHPFGYQTLSEGYTRLINGLRRDVTQLLKQKFATTDQEEIKEIEEAIELKIIYANNYARIMANTVVINHGVNLETYKPLPNKSELKAKFGIPEKDFVFVYVGRNSPRKQQPTLIQAFKEVNKKYRNSWLVLGCMVQDTGWDLLEVIDQVDAPADRIIFLNNSSAKASGGLTDSDINEVYNSGDCFVSPCFGGGFELCHLESMATGLPQIGVKGAGSIDLMVKDHGILVPAQKVYLGGQAGPFTRPVVTPHDLADAMKNMIKDEKKRASWGKAAIKYANQSEFSWDFATAEFEKLISKVLQEESVVVEGVTYGN